LEPRDTSNRILGSKTKEESSKMPWKEALHGSFHRRIRHRQPVAVLPRARNDAHNELNQEPSPFPTRNPPQLIFVGLGIHLTANQRCRAPRRSYGLWSSLDVNVAFRSSPINDVPPQPTRPKHESNRSNCKFPAHTAPSAIDFFFSSCTSRNTNMAHFLFDYRGYRNIPGGIAPGQAALAELHAEMLPPRFSRTPPAPSHCRDAVRRELAHEVGEGSGRVPVSTSPRIPGFR
jgi:hypothetical protein